MLGLAGEYNATYKIPFDTTTLPNKREQFFKGATE